MGHELKGSQQANLVRFTLNSRHCAKKRSGQQWATKRHLPGWAMDQLAVRVAPALRSYRYVPWEAACPPTTPRTTPKRMSR